MWWSRVIGITEIPNFPNRNRLLFGTVVSGKSHLEIRGFEKHVENGESDVTNQKSNLIGKFVLFFLDLLFDCFAGNMYVDNKALQWWSFNCKWILCTKMYWHSFISSNSSGHKPLGETEIPNSQFPIGNFRNSYESQTGHKSKPSHPDYVHNMFTHFFLILLLQ